ncbi:GNAT family N-acetyltransferase [Anoxybacillus geothermalis]|jgi:hypothetical protein|nr:GNAT family N-acetyltransferase [Anoxybacillus geothermalis]
MDNDLYDISKYSETDKQFWNEFIGKSKNGTFLLNIDYMHYHKDRFEDFSIIIRKKNEIVAVMPGNRVGDTLYSHQGLTYGGLIILPDTKAEDVINYFNLINTFLKENGINKVIYKAIPYIYSSLPAQEDEYALFRLNAKIIACGISSVIDLSNKIPFTKSRIGSIKKAAKHHLEIKEDEGYSDYWCILTENLKNKYNTRPVHNLGEITKLKNCFPNNIKLYTVYKEDICIAGVVIYETDIVAHVQYISANEMGKKIGALDFLFNYLINEKYKHKKYFDFGTSVENQGYYLNKGLIFQKQGFGGRGVVYKQYEYSTDLLID